MKHIKFLAIGFVFLLAGKLCAEPKPRLSGSFMPDPQSFSSEAVYITSSTCETSNPSTIFISTRPALLYAINISSAGNGDAQVEVYDRRTSTSAPANPRVVAKRIDAKTAASWTFNVGVSSGLAVYNLSKTGVPACIEIIYLER